MTRWPALTLLGITCAVIIGFAVAALESAKDCLLGYDDIHEDGFGADGYGNR